MASQRLSKAGNNARHVSETQRINGSEAKACIRRSGMTSMKMKINKAGINVSRGGSIGSKIKR